jgi:hypothetical protein
VPFDGRILSGVSVLGAVVEGGSFVKAAELLGITDSGVSRPSAASKAASASACSTAPRAR